MPVQAQLCVWCEQLVTDMICFLVLVIQGIAFLRVGPLDLFADSFAHAWFLLCH